MLLPLPYALTASDKKRLDADQTSVGIEEGIPTAAGAGTTQAQDDKAQEALSDSKAKPRQAKVPADYENVDCPTPSAGGDNASKTHKAAATKSTSGADDTEAGQDEAQRSTARKLKDTIKGDVKILSGKMTSKPDKVQAGKDIKRGAGSSDLPPARPPPSNNQMDVDDDDNQPDFELAIGQIDVKQVEKQESTDPSAMLAFYKVLLPFKSLYTWLNRDLPHQPTRNFTHREFAYSLHNEVYIRYNSFSTWEEWKQDVVKYNPARFEIGPVYTAKPKDRKTVQKAVFKPLSRELVFDIDMTDYDSIRTCCSGKGICKRCWSFIAVAVQVLDEALRSDFGFKHLLWVYSGRRGIHLWISDKDACELADDARKAIVGWLEVVKGGAQQKKKVEVGGKAGLHPALRRAVGKEGESGPLTTAFVETVLRDQDCFRQREQWELLLSLLPASESTGINKLRTKWGSHSNRSSMDKWSDVMEQGQKAGEVKQKTVWRPALEEIILQYTYPRIDAEVSKHMNHLLKSPFVVHPATGKVCVPLEVKDVAAFDPEKDCPTVAQLLRELNEWKARNSHSNGNGEVNGEGRGLKGEWDKTSLGKYVDILDRHCQAIVKEVRDSKRVMQAESMEF